VKGRYVFFTLSLVIIIGLFAFMYYIGFLNLVASESEFLQKYTWLELGKPVFSFMYLIVLTIIFILILSIMVRLIISLKGDAVRFTSVDIDDLSIKVNEAQFTVKEPINIDKGDETPAKIDDDTENYSYKINELELENEIEEKLDRAYRDIYLMIREIGSCTSVSDLFEKLLQKGAMLSGSKRGSIMIVDKSKELTVFKTLGWKESEANKISSIRIPLGEGVSGFVAAENKRVFVTNVETYKDFEFKYKEQYSSKAFISMPISGIKRVVAVLNITENPRGYYTMGEMEALNILTYYCAKIFELIQLKKKTTPEK